MKEQSDSDQKDPDFFGFVNDVYNHEKHFQTIFSY